MFEYSLNQFDDSLNIVSLFHLFSSKLSGLDRAYLKLKKKDLLFKIEKR